MERNHLAALLLVTLIFGESHGKEGSIQAFYRPLVVGGRAYFLSKPDPDNHDVRRSESICEDIGGYLAEVDDEEEYKLIKGLVKSHTDADFYAVMLGGSDSANEREWVFDRTNKTIEYLVWGPNQPNDHGKGQDCLGLWGNENWTMADFGCLSGSKRMGFVCEIETSEHQELFFPPSALGGHTYFLSMNSLDEDGIQKAEYLCETIGGYVAEVDNQEEFELIQNLMRSHHNDDFDAVYLGGTDEDQERAWVFQHSKKKVEFTDWALDEPNNPIGAQHCLGLMARGGWRMADVECQNQPDPASAFVMRFVCEVEA